MLSLEGSAVATLLEAAIAGFSVLGGFMAVVSGALAAIAYWRRQGPEVLAKQMNLGVAAGFTVGVLPGITAFIVALVI